MKIFLTGGTGFIGQRIALHFAYRADTVHALIRSPGKDHLLNHPNIKLFEGDINNPASLENAARGCDVCIHAAAFSALYTRDKRIFEKVNVVGTRNVHYAAQAGGVRKFIYISTAGTFGPQFNGPANESTRNTTPLFTDYGRTKEMAEDWLQHHNTPGMETVILNLTRVFGPGQLTQANATTRMIQSIVNGWRFLPGDGKSRGNYIFIDDVLQAVQKAIEKGRGGERYIIGSENLDFKSFFEMVREKAGLSQPFIKVPMPLVMFAARIMQALAPLGVQPLITPPWVKRYSYDWVMDNSKAVHELGLVPTPVETGIEKTIDWLREGSSLMFEV